MQSLVLVYMFIYPCWAMFGIKDNIESKYPLYLIGAGIAADICVLIAILAFYKEWTLLTGSPIWLGLLMLVLMINAVITVKDVQVMHEDIKESPILFFTFSITAFIVLELPGYAMMAWLGGLSKHLSGF